MIPSAFILVIAAAVIHVAWNLAARQARGQLIAVWGGMWIGGLAALCVYLAVNQLSAAGAQITRLGLLCALVSGIVHAGYFGLLAAAYRRGDLSVVYPVARGSAIALIAITAWVVLEENVSFRAALGIAAVTIGVGCTGHGLRRLRREWLLALAVGVMTALYSLVDKRGVNALDPILYIAIIWLVAGFLLTPLMWRSSKGLITRRCFESLKPILLIGLGSVGAYLLVLFAMRLAPVSYVAATREIAIPIGALVGIIFLQEKMSRARVFGVALILLGCVLVKIG